MPSEELKSIDDYEIFLTERLSAWSPAQRVALAAAIAERWLPIYERFSAEEQWGDAPSLRRTLDAVWSHVQGHPLSARDRARHLQQIEDSTPHMDDFDAEEALIACANLNEAVQCCGDAENTLHHAVRTALGVFEGLVEDWPMDPPSQARVWQKSAIRKELQAQLKLLEPIEAVTIFDAEAVKKLRGTIAGLQVKAAAKPKPKGPPTLTNQTAFEQYRRMVESDVRGQVKGQPEPPADSFIFALGYLGYWLGRYSRRMQTINGSYGQLGDEQGQKALMARNRACDAAEKGVLDWDPSAREMIEISLKNNSRTKVLDAGAIEQPHAYGPSLRALWLRAKRQGMSNLDAWRQVRVWANHRPAAWEVEDRRKKQGLAHASRELGEKLAQPLAWRATNDPLFPWSVEVDGSAWRIRVNDFPDDLMYTLMIGTDNAGDFHDWPGTWQR